MQTGSDQRQLREAIYVTLGIFLIFVAKDSLANRSLIWFAVWPKLVHAGIMLVQAIVDGSERASLVGDAPALLFVAVVLAFLRPKGGDATARASQC